MVAAAPELRGLTPAQLDRFHEDGYLVIEGFYPPDEVDLLRETFMRMHRDGPGEPYFHPTSAEAAGGDPLRMYPRVMRPHRFNDVARSYLLDRRLEPVLHDLFGEQPPAAQSMLYFKPTGGRGQALHQDMDLFRDGLHGTGRNGLPRDGSPAVQAHRRRDTDHRHMGGRPSAPPRDPDRPGHGVGPTLGLR